MEFHCILLDVIEYRCISANLIDLQRTSFNFEPSARQPERMRMRASYLHARRQPVWTTAPLGKLFRLSRRALSIMSSDVMGKNGGRGGRVMEGKEREVETD